MNPAGGTLERTFSTRRMRKVLGMMFYQLACLVFGAALAQRFKFIILGPAAVLAFSLGASLEMARAGTLSRIVLVSMASAASLQVGYFIGLGIRLLSRPRLQDAESRTSSARHSAY